MRNGDGVVRPAGGGVGPRPVVSAFVLRTVSATLGLRLFASETVNWTVSGQLGLRPFASEMIPRIISGQLAHSQQLTRAVMFMPVRLMSSGARVWSGLAACAVRSA